MWVLAPPLSVVVVHSCKLHWHIKHEWEGYLVDVGLGRYPSMRHPAPSWQNREGLAPQSGQSCLMAGQVPTTDLSLSRSTCPFPSIFDHSLYLPHSVWPNCLSLRNGFVLIFIFLSLYIEIFYYKICLEAEKVAEKITFSECKQTYENIF